MVSHVNSTNFWFINVLVKHSSYRMTQLKKTFLFNSYYKGFKKNKHFRRSENLSLIRAIIILQIHGWSWRKFVRLFFRRMLDCNNFAKINKTCSHMHNSKFCRWSIASVANFWIWQIWPGCASARFRALSKKLDTSPAVDIHPLLDCEIGRI